MRRPVKLFLILKYISVPHQFPKLLFADEIRLNMSLVSDPENRRGYGTGTVDATTLYRVECEYTARKDQQFEPFCSDQHSLDYKVNSDGELE